MVTPIRRKGNDPGSYGGKQGRMYSSCMPAASPTRRGPPTPTKLTAKPSTNMPAAAAQLLTDSSVPRVTSTHPTGSTASSVRARWRGLPGICDSAPSATAPNSAYGAIAALPSAYRLK